MQLLIEGIDLDKIGLQRLVITAAFFEHAIEV